MFRHISNDTPATHAHLHPSSTEIRQRYERALATFVAKVQRDRYIVAAILFGSLSHDEVWEKSDIDITLISRDDKKANKHYTVVEDDIYFHVDVEPRVKFKESLERNLQGGFIHSATSLSTLLFSTDEAIQSYYDTIKNIGDKDREIQILRAATGMLPTLTKAEKWLFVKHDPAYSFLWLMYVVRDLATVEVFWHRQIPGREVIQQALKLNPELFTALYTDLVNQPKDEATIQKAIQMIHTYLDERLFSIFKPILDYLAEAGGVRTTSEIDEYLKQRTQYPSFGVAYEWLALEKHILRLVPSPLRLVDKSIVTVNEAAYYYDGGENNGE